MSVFADSDSRTCGCLGCRKPAAFVIDHPKHGERVVCEGDAENYEVIRRV